MKYTLLIIAALLVSCEPYSTENTSTFALPRELKNCQIFKLSNTDGAQLTIVRCPNSFTGVSEACGKSICQNATVERDTAGLGVYLELQKKFGK